MASIEITRTLYISLDIASNEIDKEGCLWLSRSNWKNLSALYLGTKMTIQVRTRLVREGAKCWPKTGGSSSLYYLYVRIYSEEHNRITEKGCIKLTKMQCPNLSQLELSDNEIEIYGHQVLARMGEKISVVSEYLEDMEEISD